jgi:hypothetical protein
VNGFWKSDGKDDLSGELGSGPQPSDDLVRNISSRVRQERPRKRISARLTGGSALAAAAVLGLGLTGGLGAAANGVADTAKAVFSPGPNSSKNIHVEKVAGPAVNQYGTNIKVGVCHLVGKKYVFVLVSINSSLALGRSTRDIVGMASAADCPTGGIIKVETAKNNHLLGAISRGVVTINFTIAANNNVRNFEIVALRGNSVVRIKGTIAKLQKVLNKTFSIGGSGKVTVQLKTWIAGGATAIAQIKV